MAAGNAIAGAANSNEARAGASAGGGGSAGHAIGSGASGQTTIGTAAGLPALQISDLHAWYGESHVLHGVELVVQPGEVVTLLGRNGAGRTTTLRAIMGLTGARRGSIRINGVEAIGTPAHRIAHLGVGYCPEERGIFASLTCQENLLLPPRVAAGAGMSVDEIFAMFPNLRERAGSPGTRLSGGEQQMLAVARILRTGARILLLDEISEGLAPVIVRKLAQMVLALRQRGFTIVMVEQNFRFAAPLADRFYVLEHGSVVDSFSAAELPARTQRLGELLGV
jgi:branched-chain amino acid transport system ATP-binding protein